MIDTTTRSNQTQQHVDDRPEVLAHSSSIWQQEVVSQNPLVGKLLQPEFDQANFLYNMYKSCTIGEIEDFKISLKEVREATVVRASRDALTSKSSQITHLVKDILQLDTQIKLKLSPSITKLDETSLKIQHSLLAQIEELKSQASRLVMTQKCEEIVRESQLVFECLQKVSYAYNFGQRKILDPLSLSVALKQLAVLSPDQRRKLAANIPQIAVKLDLLQEIQLNLEKQTRNKFEDAFENKDRQNLVQCIQVFFNMEILSDQIQSRTNFYLKQLHASWIKSVKELNEETQQQESKIEEAVRVDRSLGVFIDQMTATTMKVYTMSLALSEQDPTSATTTFEAMQETLQQTGLSNVFRLFWDMLCKIVRMRLQSTSTEFPYIFSTIAARYPVFLLFLKNFWDQILAQIQPTDKIRLLELKQSIFSSAELLKQHYFDNFLVRQLTESRIQIGEVLNNSFENLDKYRIVTQQKKADSKAKIVNPYMVLADSFALTQDLKTQEKVQLQNSVEDLLSAMHIHLETVNTQIDLRNDVIQICKSQLTSLLQTDLLNNIVKFQLTDNEDDYEHQLAFNMVIFDLAKQIAQYFSSKKFKELLQADNSLQVSKSVHIKREFQLKGLQQEAQEMCSKLFEKVYSVFISHLKTQIYPELARLSTTMPHPLKEDDLDFGSSTNENGQEEEQNEENSKSFTERLQAWKQSQIDQTFQFQIPVAVKNFNQKFEAILSKMTLENITPSELDESQQQWILKERKIRLLECVDEILHFFVIRNIQIDLFHGFSCEQREQIFKSLEEMYDSLVGSFADLVEINVGSRMVTKHKKYLQLIKEDPGIEDQLIPFHLRLCLAQPAIKTILIRNIYICERNCLRACLFNQKSLAKSAVSIYEKTLQEIRKNLIEGKNDSDAQAIIVLEEKLAMIDAKLAEVAAASPSEEAKEPFNKK